MNKVKRTIPPAQTQTELRRRLNLRQKSRAYDSLHDLHRGFEITRASLERLDRMNIVSRIQLRPCRDMAEELQALTNVALLAVLRDTEEYDAGHYEKLRLDLKRHLDPNPPEKKRSK